MKKLLVSAIALASILLAGAASAQTVYQEYGDTTYVSDGSSYTTFGENSAVDDRGHVYRQHGNTTYGSDGSTYARASANRGRSASRAAA